MAPPSDSANATPEDGASELPNDARVQAVSLAQTTRALREAARDPPDFLAWTHESFALAPATELIGVVVAAHKCREVNLYGFQIQSFEGVKDTYHEREDGRDADPDADPAADLDRRAGEDARERHSEMDDDEWLVLKAMATHGVIRFAEPCVVRCHESASGATRAGKAEARLTGDDDRDASRGGGSDSTPTRTLAAAMASTDREKEASAIPSRGG